jgi:hypothetical protein
VQRLLYGPIQVQVLERQVLVLGQDEAGGVDSTHVRRTGSDGVAVEVDELVLGVVHQRGKETFASLELLDAHPLPERRRSVVPEPDLSHDDICLGLLVDPAVQVDAHRERRVVALDDGVLDTQVGLQGSLLDHVAHAEEEIPIQLRALPGVADVQHSPGHRKAGRDDLQGEPLVHVRRPLAQPVSDSLHVHAGSGKDPPEQGGAGPSESEERLLLRLWIDVDAYLEDVARFGVLLADDAHERFAGGCDRVAQRRLADGQVNLGGDGAPDYAVVSPSGRRLDRHPELAGPEARGGGDRPTMRDAAGRLRRGDPDRVGDLHLRDEVALLVHGRG